MARCSVRPPGGKGSHYWSGSRHWERPGLRWEVGVEGGAGGGFGQADRSVIAFGAVRVGLHQVVDYERYTLRDEEAGGAMYCSALLLCGLGGITKVPKSGFIGNERGLDLRLEAGWAGTEPNAEARLRIGLKPVFRIASGSSVRVASFLGAVLPELGFEWRSSSSNQITFDWSPYPMGFRLGGVWRWSGTCSRLGLECPSAAAAWSHSSGRRCRCS